MDYSRGMALAGSTSTKKKDFGGEGVLQMASSYREKT